MEKFRAFREWFRYGERTASFEKWEKLIVRHKGGMPFHRAPQSFTMTDTFMKAFDEMLPVKDGKLDTSIENEAVDKATKRLEVGRGITCGPGGKHLTVETKDSGRSEAKPEGSYLFRDPVPFEVGSVHTHPPGLSIMPSSPDVCRILQGEAVSIVVSPKKVVTLVRSDKTPFHPERAKAEKVMSEMGKKKSKQILVFSASPEKTDKDDPMKGKEVWSTSYADLSDLYIISYEAKRGKNIFVRV